MGNYSKEEAESTERVQYVVYDRRNTARFVVGHALNWQSARDRGAKNMGIPSEFAWAVPLLDGEAPSSAVARGVGMDSMMGVQS